MAVNHYALQYEMPTYTQTDVTANSLHTGYKQDRSARSVSFGYSQDNANQQPTNGNYCIFLEASNDSHMLDGQTQIQ